MQTFDKVYDIVLLVIGILFFYRTIYMFISFFFKSKKFETHPHDKAYAILIPARNESAVILNLIDSIQKQTYNNTKITIFVVADNCTDNTASISKNAGAVVYERFNKQQVSKGYALQYLLNHIEKDYKITNFDGYFVFDADNIIATNFIEKMHDAFSYGNDVVISYRNTKNFDDNFISASYGIHFYRNSFSSHRPRNILRLSTNITGTGFLVDSDILKDGWKWTNLTEDCQLTMTLVSMGKKIDFCEEAQLYDEQPTDLKTAYKQRLRWNRGGLECFFMLGGRLFLSLLRKPSFKKYDMFLHTLPIGLITFLLGLTYQIVKSILYYTTNGSINFLSTLTAYRDMLILGYATAFITGIFVLIREHKHIKCNFFKLMWYLILWPLYDLATLPLTIIILFKRIEWKPIVHKDSKTISDIEGK